MREKLTFLINQALFRVYHDTESDDMGREGGHVMNCLLLSGGALESKYGNGIEDTGSVAYILKTSFNPPTSSMVAWHELHLTI